jgi:hypothetical protein
MIVVEVQSHPTGDAQPSATVDDFTERTETDVVLPPLLLGCPHDVMEHQVDRAVDLLEMLSE